MNDSDLYCVQLSVIYNDSEANSHNVAEATSVFQVLLHIVLLPLSILLSLLLIILIAGNKQLQTSVLIIALQVVCLDLIGEVMTAVSVFSSAGGHGWVLGWQVCTIPASLFFLIAVARSQLICVLAITHFLYVFAPHMYSRVHKKMSAGLSLVSWLTGAIYATIPLPGILDCYKYQIYLHHCILDGQCSETCSESEVILWMTSVFPFFIGSFVLYLTLFCKACYLKRNSQTEKSQNITKTIMVFFLISLITLLFTWPFHVITVVVENFATSEVPGIVLMLVSGTLNDLLVIFDPLFIFCNGDVKKALKTFLKHHFPVKFGTSS